MDRMLYRIFGSLTIRCEGGFTGRFLDMCRASGVAFRNAKSADGKLYMKITPEELYKVRHIARESGMKVKVTDKSGAVFFLHRYRRRWGIIAGFVCFMLIIYHLSGFVWNVEISGESERYSAEEIVSALEERGIAVGMPLSGIDTEKAENSILTELDGLKRLAISVKSTSVTVEIADKTENQPEEEEGTGYPSNITAGCDAYIIGVLPYSGKAVVKPGDTVTKGQVLVSGIYEDSTGKVYLTEAKAQVIGQTVRKTQIEISLYNEKEEYTGNQRTKNSLFFYGLNIKFYFDGGNRYDKYDIINKRRQLEIFGHKLPVYIETVTERETAADGRKLTEEELNAKIEEVLDDYESVQLSETSVVSRSVEKEIRGDVCVLSVTYVCQEEIGVKTEISLERTE